jgi:hypothetical protein
LRAGEERPSADIKERPRRNGAVLLFKIATALPTIEVVPSSRLAASHGQSNQPENKEDGRDNPEQMGGKSNSEEKQDNE